MGKKSVKRILIILVLLLPILYVGVQAFSIFSNSYQTQTAVEYTMSDSIICSGALGMTETEIAYDGGGVIGYVASNGERVKAGDAVAEVFATELDAQNSQYAKRLQKEIDVLTKASGATSSTDVELLVKQKYSNAYDALDVLQSNNMSGLNDKKLALQLAIDKAAAATFDNIDFTARIQQLTSQQQAAQAVQSQYIASPVTGYFVAGEDSTKRLYTTDQLMAMSPVDFAAAVSEETPANDALVAGKIISDYRWYYLASVDLATAAKFDNYMQNGYSVDLSFPDVSEKIIPATVENVVTDEENNLAVITLACDYINSSIIALEHAPATITFNTYTGIRVSKAARRIVDGVTGVYIKYGNVAYFRPIEILYEDANYILVPTSYTVAEGQKTLKIFDEVIIGGINLSNGKLL